MAALNESRRKLDDYYRAGIYAKRASGGNTASPFGPGLALGYLPLCGQVWQCRVVDLEVEGGRYGGRR